MKIFDFQKMKQRSEKISMITCYDYWSAQIIAASAIDAVLVGDSLAMVMHGHQSTIPATIDVMTLHTLAVAKGIGDKFLITDMPFLAHRKGLTPAMDAVEKLIQAGAHAVKIEGAQDNLDLISHIVASGIPVMGHIGLQGQAINNLGGFKIQGKGLTAADIIFKEAQQLEQAGCFAIVLECVPAPLAKKISEAVTVPIIGIGAGSQVDGQILVLHDLLGFNAEFKPKFLKQYFSGFQHLQNALNQFSQEVKEKKFPAIEHCYTD